MNALTLWPEWVAAIVHLGKPLENRGPESPRWLRRAVGTRIAIHAGKHVGGRAGWTAFSEADEAIELTAEAAGHPGIRVVHKSSQPGARFLAKYDAAANVLDWAHPIPLSAVVLTAVVGEPHRPSGKPWEADGDGWCWPLLEVVTLTGPVPCRGAQGLWAVPDDVLAAVRAQGGCP